jgi:hypothetical protein
MHYKFLFAVMVIAVVFASGCTLPFNLGDYNSNTPEGAGVIIESFAPEFAEVYSGETVVFNLKVRNSGSIKAEGGFAEMLGLDQTWLPGTDEEGKYRNEELFPNENECEYKTRGITLLPADQATGIQGADHICTWNYIAPVVPAGLYTDARPRVRFFYNYKSHAVKTLTLVPRDELRNLQQQGKSLPSESTSKSKSPIDIDIAVSSPLRVSGVSNEKIQFPVVIDVKNVGDGTVCTDAYSCKVSSQGGPSWNMLQISIDLPDGVTFRTCGDPGSSTKNMDVYLNRGSSQTYTCLLEADQPNAIVQKTIRIDAEYGYFVDKTTSVKVLSSQAGV